MKNAIINLRCSLVSTAVVWVGCSLVGCSGGPSAVPIPKFDPEASAERAIELHDVNNDGLIGGEELDTVPGLKAAMRNVDANQDGQASAQEISDRLVAINEMGLGLMSVSCDVNLNGQALTNATVIFEPEPFLGGVIESARGETGMGGNLRPAVPKDKRPSPTSPPGMQAGFYRVKVSKKNAGKEMIPEQYNANTVLGQQISNDDYAIVNKQVIFDLKSKKAK